MNVTVNDLLMVSNGKLLCGNKQDNIGNCFVDSRKACYLGCFFGIKGNNNDGSLFYKEAIKNGAKVCVLNNNFEYEKIKGITIILVDDPLLALQNIATYKRNLFNGPVIGITGSVGKTSTKEMVVNVLESKFKVLKTLGNENSQVGLPLTIMRLMDEECMVLEMGMSNIGELHKLSMIAKPTVSIITNVLTAHIGNLKTRENILKAKLEILDGMKHKKLIINADNDMLQTFLNRLEDKSWVYTYGIDNGLIKAFNINEGMRTTFDVNEIKELSILGGKEFIYNALAAISVGKMFEVGKEQIKLAINKKSSIPHRLELIDLKRIKLIDDTYNASFDSMKAALTFLKEFDGRKIAILGDILELGKESKAIHKKIGKEVVDNGVDYLITIGKDSKEIKKAAIECGLKRKFTKHFNNELNSRKYLNNLIKKNDIILVKGSNAMKLVNIVNYLCCLNSLDML